MTTKIALAVAVVLGMVSASLAAPKSSLPKNGEPLYFKYATGEEG